MSFTSFAHSPSAFAWADLGSTRPMEESGLFGPEHPSAAREWRRLADELLKIRGLGEDWDGQGAEAPSPALVDWATSLAQSFPVPADRVVAGVDGTVLFEWYLPTGYLEVEVTAPTEAECRFVRRGSERTEIIPLPIGRGPRW